MYRYRSTRGFTLIELLVVIAIIGLLSSVVLASLNTARVKGLDAQRRSNLLSVQTALELYATDHNGNYPTSSGWQSTCPAWGSFASNNTIPGLVSGGYIPSLPVDSQVDTGNNYCCYLYNSNGTDYKYLFHNCLSSVACYGGTEAQSGALADPARPTWACAIYSPGAAGW